jgi:hypothetical protein
LYYSGYFSDKNEESLFVRGTKAAAGIIANKLEEIFCKSPLRERNENHTKKSGDLSNTDIDRKGE